MAKTKQRTTSRRPPISIATIERGLKTRIISLLMLVLASSLGLWFAEFQTWAILLWLLVSFAGGYIIFEFSLFVSKALVVLSALIMEFLVLEGTPHLFVPGSPANLMLGAFVLLDALLVYALSKL